MIGMTAFMEQSDDDLLLAVKAVPGGSRDEIAGVLGDRLKIKVSAPAEGGKANKAICQLLAKALRIKKSHVTINAGQSSTEKTVRIIDVSLNDVKQELAPYVD